MRRVVFLVRKELLELRQDPNLLRVVLVAPILQLLVLGYAATTDVKNIPVVVVDADRSAASRELIRRFDASSYFTIADIVSSVDEMAPYLDDNRAWMALSIPAAYGRGIGAGTPVAVQVVADGSDASSTTVALGYATNLVALRGIVLKGIGFEILAPQIGAMALFSLIVLGLASVRLAKERG